MSEPSKTSFAPLSAERHVCLTTYRRSGEPVPTPLWFVELEGRLYARTASHFGKVKRIRREPRVVLAACTAEGEITGPEIPGAARLMEADESAARRADAALDAKYGEERRAATRLLETQGWSGVYIEIAPASSDSSRR